MAELALQARPKRKMIYVLRDFITKPENIILLLTVVILGFFTVYPVVLLVSNTLKVNIADLFYPALVALRMVAASSRLASMFLRIPPMRMYANGA